MTTEKFASFNWMRGVADDKNITHLHRLILVRLCLYRDNKTGQCNPGIQVVADELKVFRTTVFRAVDAGIKRGWLAGTSNHGGRVARNFIFTFPFNRSGTATVNRSGTATVKTPTVAVRHSNRSGTALQPSQAILQDTELPNKFAPEREKRTGKRTGKKRERALSPDDAALGKKRKSRAREESKLPAKCEPGAGETTASKCNVDVTFDELPLNLRPVIPEPAAELVPATDDAFLRFWAVYPRKVEQVDARAAFAKAIKDGADLEAMIARATCYGLERAMAIGNGDDPKFTLYPATWLKKKKWNDPYPEGVIRDEDGNIVAIEQADKPEEENTLTLALRMAREAGVSW